MMLSPGIVLGVCFISLFVYYALGFASDEAKNRKRDGSILMPVVFLDFFYWFANPIVGTLASWGLHPNQVTTVSFVAALASGFSFGAAYFMTGFWMLFIAATCDVLDGFIARERGLQTESGAFWDSFMDRLSEGVVFAGLAYYGQGGVMTWLAIWAILASFGVSYARARGEGLGVDCAVGLMQRPERMLVLIFGTFFGPLVALFVEPDAQRPVYHLVVLGLGLIAVLSTVTAFRRANWIFNELNRDKAGSESVELSDTQPNAASDG
jgi:CDP-diacylglycerol--glycerol-3-phosphate 3-phosphatidyltransferase